MAEENSLGDGISLSPLLGTLRQLISDARSRALQKLRLDLTELGDKLLKFGILLIGHALP